MCFYSLILQRVYVRTIASTGLYQGYSESMFTWTWYGPNTDQIRTRYGAGNMRVQIVLKKCKFAQCNALRVLPIHLLDEPFFCSVLMWSGWLQGTIHCECLIFFVCHFGLGFGSFIALTCEVKYAVYDNSE